MSWPRCRGSAIVQRHDGRGITAPRGCPATCRAVEFASSFSGDMRMKALTPRLTALALAVLAVLVLSELSESDGPVLAQQEVPMRGNTPIAPQGIKVPPLPDA